MFSNYPPASKHFWFLPHFRYLLVQVEDVETDKKTQRNQSPTSPDQKTLLGRYEIKGKFTELFSPNKLKARNSKSQLPPSPTEKKKENGHSECTDWTAGYMPRSRAEIPEACRQAFVATSHLMLECTTFPVYYSEEETLALHTDMFGPAGEVQHLHSSELQASFCE